MRIGIELEMELATLYNELSMKDREFNMPIVNEDELSGEGYGG